MTDRRHAHRYASPSRTGGDERPRPACQGNPTPYDVLMDFSNGPAHKVALREAREMCGFGVNGAGEVVQRPAAESCPLRDACMSRNQEEQWARAVMGLDTRKEPTTRHNCGTKAGYQAHHKFGENPCEPCTIANRTSAAAYAAKKKEKKTLAEYAAEGRAAKAQRDHDDRLAELRHMISIGHTLADVLDRLGVNREALRIWCKRNDHLDVWAELLRASRREVAA